MRLLLTFLLITSFQHIVSANDGAFFAKGNQLIPITETNIKVQKEVLSLKKVANKQVEVTVHYEFFNPGKEKSLTVGFEAFSPSGDVDGTTKNGQHPYMRDFTVLLNEKPLKYNIAYVKDSVYTKNGIIKGAQLSDIKKGIDNVNEVDFFYIYHFKAVFKPGLNIIKHTYTYDLSGSIDYNYNFEYVLTAANRWGNQQIDDFTLIVDVGEFETFSILKSFFKKDTEWLIRGIGKTEDVKGLKNSLQENDALKFHIQSGTLVFHKKNFKPKAELFLYAQNYLGFEQLDYLPFSYYQQDHIPKPKNDWEKKILKNLPFARRGYVFQSSDLKKYYERLDWYQANPKYIPDLKTLNEVEKEWLKNNR
ncbi:YARHG domain-containing protein [Pedobacter gandavensis]|uniref:YARHG domain-containing protein n=1 Tax=Pedobacter gandavensis TaxID=2679963 RepID=UPI0029315FED|nr:YARHG domain-containing protein [Pedobacter gandavensis]